MKRFAVALVAGALLSAAWPDPATADVLPYYWQDETICIDDRTTSMPVRDVIEFVDPRVVAELVYQPGCAGYRQTVVVTEEHRPGVKWGGLTTLYPDSTGRIMSATIVFNLSTIGHHDRRANLSLVSHEVMHCLGLGHNDRAGSVMNYETQYKYQFPTTQDLTEANVAWILSHRPPLEDFSKWTH